MNLNHKVYQAYIRLAQGRLETYSDAIAKVDMRKALDGQFDQLRSTAFEPSKIDAEICKARQIPFAKYYELGIVLKPATVANLIYCSELRKAFGDITGVPGFNKQGIFILPKWQGVLAPIKEYGEIIELRFYSLSKLLKKQKAAGG